MNAGSKGSIRAQIVVAVSIVIALLSIAAGHVSVAYANQNEVYEGVKTDTGYQLGVGGAITVKDPKVSPTGFNNHRDYMLYINDASVSGTVGAGYFTMDGSTFYDLIYRRTPGGVTNHDLYTTISLNTSFTATVTEQNDNPTSRCWYAVTYQGSNTQCFSTSTISGASNIGAIARTFSSYSSGTNDLYGYIYNLQSKYKLTASPYTVDWEDFTDAAVTPGIYKCWSTKSAYGSGYVIDYQTDENTIGTGPRTYTTDDCNDVSQVWDPYGERSTAGGN